MKILIFPEDQNPYQQNLYTHINQHGITTKYFYGSFLKKHAFTLGSLLLWPRLLHFRLKGYSIFHIHWTYAFVIPFNNKFLRELISFMYAIFFISSLKLFHFKLIWSVHDIQPHRKETIADNIVTKFLLRNCSGIHILSKGIREEINKLSFNKKIFFIPHGNYVNTYPNKVTRTEARSKLNIKSKAFVFLYLGIIDKYKGVNDLLYAFSKIRNKDTVLIIAGDCIDKKLRQHLTKIDDKEIIVTLKRIQANDLQYYFNAADISVLPFKKITTSGSVLLPGSFNKTVIAPKLGNILDIPDNCGFFYNPQTDLLEDIMESAYTNNTLQKEKETAMSEYIKSLDWNVIATKTIEMYKDIN